MDRRQDPSQINGFSDALGVPPGILKQLSRAAVQSQGAPTSTAAPQAARVSNVFVNAFNNNSGDVVVSVGNENAAPDESRLSARRSGPFGPLHVVYDGELRKVDTVTLEEDENGKGMFKVWFARDDDGERESLHFNPKESATMFSETLEDGVDFDSVAATAYMNEHIDNMCATLKIAQTMVGKLAGVSQGKVSKVLKGQLKGDWTPLLQVAYIWHVVRNVDGADDLHTDEFIKALLEYDGDIDHTTKKKKRPGKKYEFHHPVTVPCIRERLQKIAKENIKTNKKMGLPPPSSITVDAAARTKIAMHVQAHCKQKVESGGGDAQTKKIARRGSSFGSSPRNHTYLTNIIGKIPDKDQIIKDMEKKLESSDTTS